MRKFATILIATLVFLLCQVAIQAQVTGAINGTVTDPNGDPVPGAAVKIKGTAGQEFNVVTNDDGVFRVPAVQNGLYTVTVTARGFKTQSVSNVKVDVGTPVTVDAKLLVGDVGEVVQVTSGAEVLQTQTATVSSSVTGRQITNTPIASRDALDLVLLMPGTNTVGAPRRSSINGLPKGAISISIDGVDVQDNSLRSSDGYFTYVRPRVDAIEEVTVTSAATGADVGGDGAVQIKFVTKRGNNEWSGGGFYQRRHESLNANYWYNNATGLARSLLRLQQYGAHFSGPIPFLRFGEGVPAYSSGKDKRFFFVNYEEYRLPSSLARTRTILTTQAQNGIFAYIGTTPSTGLPTACTTVTATTMRCERDLFAIAGAATNVAPGRVTTPDPLVAAVLARIRSSVATTGTITQVIGATTLTRENYNFAPSGQDIRKFLAARFDINITKRHSVEFVMNRQDFGGTKDFLNSQDERFPGFPFYAQVSKRNSYTIALRSSFGQRLVNEFRFAESTGFATFSPGISAADFAYSGGITLGIDAAGITTPYSRNSFSERNTPTYDWTDSMTWIRGNHTINFGGQYKRIDVVDTNQGRIVPTISFGMDSSETNLVNTFSTANLPGAASGTLTDARNLYASLIGHVTGYTGTALLEADGQYRLNGIQTKTDTQKTYGLFAQDSWKLRPNLTVTYGLRWQPQGPFIVTSSNYARLASFDQVYGVSGLGNVFKPGTLTGTPSVAVGMVPGEKLYKGDNKNFAPSAGMVWSPNWGNNGFLGTLFGGNGKSVFRGGYSVSFVREGTALIASLQNAIPGGSLTASRSTGIGNLVTGTNLRDVGNPNLVAASFSATPSYPIALTTSNQANGFVPDLKTGSVTSFTFGYQRELDRNTVVELRYVGNRGHDLWRQHNINELNVLENGVLAEFSLARQNLEANIAANRCQTGVTAANCQYNFAYFGPGTGTVPLPISLAYITGIGAAGVSSTASYGGPGSTTAQQTAAALFRNTAFASNLSRFAPSVLAFGGNLEGAAARRQNALNAGLAPNFFFANPSTATGGAFLLDNTARSWYDGGTIEVRRRLSAGLRVNASYTFAKALSDSFQSNSDNQAEFTQRPGGRELAKGVAVFDIRHAFKLDTTYDLPFGKGRTFFRGANKWVDGILGGFSLAPVLRWQSGSPIQVGNVQLVGMTRKELQSMIKVRKTPGTVYWLPDDIILNSRRAFGTDPLSATGYGSLGVPTGKFFAPAGYGDCKQVYSGQCGFANLVLYGPSFFKLDASLSKRISLGERRNIELRVTSLDVLNHPNFRLGGWNSDIVTSGCCGATFGQFGQTAAYQDISTTNDPGGRIIDLMIRINW